MVYLILPFCSASCNAILTTKIKELVSNTSLYESLITIKNEFPLIERIDIITTFWCCPCNYYRNTPWFWINEYEIILINGVKVPSWWLATDQVNELQKYPLKTLSLMPPIDYHNWLTCLNADIFDNYQIVIEGPSTIYLNT